MPELVYLNGRITSFEEAFISVNDRGYILGDGVYEVIRVYRGVMFALDDHLKRLKMSAAAVDMDLPRDIDGLRAIAGDLLARSGIEEAIVYLQVTRGTAHRNHFFDPDLHPNLLVTVRNLPDLPPAMYNDGVGVITVPEFRWQMCNIKSISLQAAVMAKHMARKAGAVEAVFVLPDGTVTEGGSSNIFIYRGGILRTHPADNRILAGITRKYVIEAAESMGVEVREEPFSRLDLMGAEEAFLTSTVNEVLPVVKVDGGIIGKGRPGAVTAGIRKEFSLLAGPR